MRTCGVVDAAGTLGPTDHVCWGYASLEERAGIVAEFVADGREAGLRIAHVGAGATEAARVLLEPLGDVDGLIASGDVTIVSLDATHLDPVAQVRAVERTLHQALEDGYRGVRFVADITPRMTPDASAALARYEHLVDRFMAKGDSCSGLCCYDRAAVAPGVAHTVACLHPLSNDHELPLQVFAADSHADLTLLGEFDAFGTALFQQALESTEPPRPSEDWVIDASRVTFLDHRCLEIIDKRAAAFDTTAVVQAGSTHAATLNGILELAHVRVVEWF